MKNPVVSKNQTGEGVFISFFKVETTYYSVLGNSANKGVKECLHGVKEYLHCVRPRRVLRNCTHDWVCPSKRKDGYDVSNSRLCMLILIFHV